MFEKSQLPEWDLNSIYTSTKDLRFEADLAKVKQLNFELKSASLLLDKSEMPTLKQGLLLARALETLLLTMEHYLKSVLSLDYSNDETRKALAVINTQKAQFDEGMIPFKRVIVNCELAVIAELNQDSDLSGFDFYLSRLRREGEVLALSDAEDALISSLKADGHDAWENLYYSLASNLKVQIQNETGQEAVGLSQALSLFMHPDARLRKSAWLGVQETWEQNQDTAAAIANSLAGWRLTLCQKRSRQAPIDFLEEPLMVNNIERATLEALMSACEKHKEAAQASGRFMAKMLNKKDLQLDPWDLLAPFPAQRESKPYSFADGIKMIKEALGAVSGELADFVQMAVDRRWIDARVLATKGVGAYCTEFPKVGEPRVFMTFGGTMYDIKTLAHELGHAYHSWLVRDLSIEEQQYPMTLAETASIFAENAFRAYFLENAKTSEERNACLWDCHSAILSFLINIPARFEYEKLFYTQRAESMVPAQELKNLTQRAWNKWYGKVLTQNDPMYWAHKVHFSFAYTSFYNFPYAFGYLFSSKLYSEFKNKGSGFFNSYKDILRDTGRMSAEQLAKAHLGQDITQKDFWSEAIKSVLIPTNEQPLIFQEALL